MPQSVFFFGNGEAEGTRDMKSVLGGKGANLAEMTNLGVPVPPGFTIACGECIAYLRDGKYSDALRAEVEGNVARLEEATGKKFGDPKNPLLVSVRSGAPVSMPGMMETILNLGLNDRTVDGLARQSNNARFAYDSYRRFIQMYSDVVLGVSIARLRASAQGAKRLTTGAKSDSDLSEDALRNLVEEYKALVRNATGAEFPDQSRRSALGSDRGGVEIVDAQEGARLPQGATTSPKIWAQASTSWRWCSATSATTREPASPSRVIPRPARRSSTVSSSSTRRERTSSPAFARRSTSTRWPQRLPAHTTELLETQDRLEQHYTDMQDLEFTVERGKLFLLQTRTGKRTAAAAVRIARDMVRRADRRTEAVKRVRAAQLDQLLHPIIDPSVRAEPIVHRAAGEPGRSERHRRVRSRQRRAASRGRRRRDPRARRDDARRFPRHRRCARGSHGARRNDEPRGGCRARHGQMRGRRLQGASRSTRASPLLGQRHDGLRRRLADARWRDRPGLSRQPSDDPERGRAGDRMGRCRQSTRRVYQSFARAARLGRRDPYASGFARTRILRATHASRATSALKASASAEPSTCSSRASASPRCAR